MIYFAYLGIAVVVVLAGIGLVVVVAAMEDF